MHSPNEEAVDTTAGPSPTYYPTPGPGLETPFGTFPQFVIHRVRAGETFSTLAESYRTSRETIQSINPLRQGISLWQDQLVVIPVDWGDRPGLPVFEIAYLTQVTHLEDLAAEWGISPEEIQRYNSLGSSQLLPPGRWLILPLPP